MASVLFLGAKSDMAKPLAHLYAKNGYDLYLAARNKGELSPDVTDLKIRYNVNVEALEFDLVEFESHSKLWESLEPKPDGVVLAAGYNGDQATGQNDFAEAKKLIDTNLTGCISILNIIANDFEARKRGFIVGISSVAGDRGKRSNYLYGCAKAGFSVYLSGLRNRLSKTRVQVLTVKPGYVDTKMLDGQDVPEKLKADPEKVAEQIYRAQQKGKDSIYTPGYWRLIMTVFNHLPEKIFKRLSF